MGLTEALTRAAARHTHVLVVEVPGWWRTRVAVEHAVLSRGWILASSAADADVLVVCGDAGPGLAEAVEQVWHQMPGPRVRVHVRQYGDAGARLDQAHRDLLDTDHHRHDAHERRVAPDLLADGGDEEAHGGHEGMDHGGHEGMDHGDMDMSPAGIPLAEGGVDRDGLEMDVLRVRLGPVLPHWPAGLVLRCALQGDVVTEARAELVDGGHPHERGAWPLARRLDNLSSLLSLAGWDDASAEARRLRDAAVQGGVALAAGQVERLRRKIRRSRTMRWSLRGLRPLSEEEARHLCLPAAAVGDSYDRLIGMVDRAADEARGEAAAGASMRHPHPAAAADGLGRLVAGLDLATLRLVVASLDLHDLRTEHTEPEMSHG